MILIRVGKYSLGQPTAPGHRVGPFWIALAGTAGAALLCIVWLIWSPVSARTALACSCAGTEDSPRAAMARYDAVFIGRVIDAYDNTDPQPSGYGTHRAVLFEVERAYKGVKQTQVIIYTDGDECCTCGVPFSVGYRYLVYASADKSNYLITTLCDPTHQTGGDLPELGPGYEPAVHVSLYDPARHSTTAANPLLLVGGVTACAALVAGLVIAGRRRTKSG